MCWISWIINITLEMPKEEAFQHATLKVWNRTCSWERQRRLANAAAYPSCSKKQLTQHFKLLHAVFCERLYIRQTSLLFMIYVTPYIYAGVIYLSAGKHALSCSIRCSSTPDTALETNDHIYTAIVMKVIIMFFYDMYMLIFINCPPRDTHAPHAPHADIITACICMIKHMLQIVSFLADLSNLRICYSLTLRIFV